MLSVVSGLVRTTVHSDDYYVIIGNLRHHQVRSRLVKVNYVIMRCRNDIFQFDLCSGLDSLMGVEVRQTLERDYDIQLSMKEVRLLTINSLRDLSTTGTQQTDNEPTTEEKPDKIDSVIVNQVIPHFSDKTLIHLNNTINGQKPLFVVHNINGSVEPLKSLAATLACPVIGLQYTKDAPRDSIQSLASFYIIKIRDVVPRGPYRLSGYSFGACVALEMSMQLEETSEVESLVLMDGSQEYVAAHTMWHRKRLTVEEESWKPEAVAEALVILAGFYANVDKIKLMESIKTLPTIDKQLVVTVDAIVNANSDIDKQNLLVYLTFFIDLLRMGEQYKPTAKYHGNVHLIRAKTTDEMGKSLGEDFGVGKICTGNVAVTWVEGDHVSFLQDNGAVEVANMVLATQA